MYGCIEEKVKKKNKPKLSTRTAVVNRVVKISFNRRRASVEITRAAWSDRRSAGCYKGKNRGKGDIILYCILIDRAR